MSHQELTKRWKAKKIDEFIESFVMQVLTEKSVHLGWSVTPDGVLSWVQVALDEAIERGYAEAESDIARWSDTE